MCRDNDLVHADRAHAGQVVVTISGLDDDRLVVVREDAVSALKTLRHSVRTFAFADREIVIEKMRADGEEIDVEVVDLERPPGKDESAFLAALLGGVARFSLPLAPGHCIVAPPHSGSGIGKGKLEHA